ARPAGRVFPAAVGGGVLRQGLVDGRVGAELDLPGPRGRVFPLRVLHPEPDARADRYVSGGYRPVLRAIVHAVNRRDLGSLDTALEAHMRLQRATLFYFVAALYSLRGAQAALGRLPSWPAPHPVFGA